MTKYLFLTTIFAINHAGRQKKEEVSPVPSHRSKQGISSSDSSREVSPDPQNRIRELETKLKEEQEENAQLQYIISEYKTALLKNEMSKNHPNLASDALSAQISNLLDRLQNETRTYKNQIARKEHLIQKLEQEIIPKCIALSKENKILKAQLA